MAVKHFKQRIENAIQSVLAARAATQPEPVLSLAFATRSEGVPATLPLCVVECDSAAVMVADAGLYEARALVSLRAPVDATAEADHHARVAWLEQQLADGFQLFLVDLNVAASDVTFQSMRVEDFGQEDTERFLSDSITLVFAAHRF